MFDADEENDLVSNGVWKEFKGSEFLIAHLSSVAFQRALARHQQPHTKKLQEGKLDPEINRQVVAKAMSEGLLLDWRKVKGNPTYTPKAGYTALMKQPDFRDFISSTAGDLNNFLKEESEDLGED